MSALPTHEPACVDCDTTKEIAAIIDGRARDLGGFSVRRVLPAISRRSIGPFVFFDHMGPVSFAPGAGIDVRPHPHIGLATVTYLFEGEILHRDSIGSSQRIRPGDLNWMTAGRGIVHSERTPPEIRAAGSRVHGLQLWVALPEEHEEVEPSFDHHAAATLPTLTIGGATVRVIAGSAYGVTAPVKTLSSLFYVDATMPAGSELAVAPDIGHGTIPPERAVFVVDGAILCGNERAERGRMLVLAEGSSVILRATTDARVVLIGGTPLGKRHLFWNFVSSSKERLEQAKRDWNEERFPLVPGDESDRIPLPG
jgi:redox-sensitive bicupin YhaK (pirin superfamily)